MGLLKTIKILSFIASLVFSIAAGSFASDNNEDSYSKIAARIRPAVVTVIVYDYNGRLKHIGSGFFYNQNGDIVTNHHVLTGNSRAEIKTFSEEKYPVGAIIERNAVTDIVKAHTHIPQKSPFLKIAANYPAVGDKIMVAGSPMGLSQTITEGIVSAWRKIPGRGNVMQISAPISPGSSGGPVLNMAGEVVGLATFQMVEGQNLNFAVPAESIFNTQKLNTRDLKFHKDKNGVLIIE